MASSVLALQPVDIISPLSPLGYDGMEDIEIYLTTSGPDASIIPLKVWSEDTIASVKLRIRTCKGYYVKQQKLVYGGRELYRENAMLKDYGVTNGKVLHLVLKLSELQVVTITTANGKDYVFRIDRMKYVRDLKERLSHKEKGFSSNEQQLVLRGEDLKDEMRIHELPLEGDASVHIFVRSTVKLRSQAVGADIELSVVAHHVNKQHSSVGIARVHPSSSRPILVDRKVDNFYLRKEVFKFEIPMSACGYSTSSIPPVLLDLIQQVKAGLDQGHAPVLSSEGSGGTYFMQDAHGTDIVGVFKPMDEEPMAANNPRGLPVSKSGEGLKRGTKVGEGALREVAAYLLDHPANGHRGHKCTGFAGVPPTVIIKCSHHGFQQAKRKEAIPPRDKIGSLQLFIHASSNCEDMGPACFPVQEVHKIAVLDIRLANTDRNGANILVCKKGEPAKWSLVPIDHGYCLPDKFEDCTFEWLYWPQAKTPFESATLKYISELDAEADIALLEEHGWKLTAECARVLRVGTLLLKKGASAGLTPYEIGIMMCREKLHELSPLETMLEDVEGRVLPEISEDDFIATLSATIDRYIEVALSRKRMKK